jgi:hypothetical protein
VPWSFIKINSSYYIAAAVSAAEEDTDPISARQLALACQLSFSAFKLIINQKFASTKQLARWILKILSDYGK